MRLALAFAGVVAACGPLPERKPPPPTKPAPVPRDAATGDPGNRREYPEVRVHKARSRFSLEVFGVQAIGTVDPGATKTAQSLTVGMRALAGTDDGITLGHKNPELIDAKVMTGCENMDEDDCAKRIAGTVRADRIIFGIVNDLGEGQYYVHVTLFDARTAERTKWTGTTYAEDTDLVYTAKVAFDSLIARSN